MVIVSQKSMGNLMFNCGYCSNIASYVDSASAYGIVLLIGDKDGYYGAVCPSCLKTTLVCTEKDDLESFKKNLFTKVKSLKREESLGLHYNSFPDNVALLPDGSRLKIIAHFEKPLSGNNGILKYNEIKPFLVKNPNLDKYYCSYAFGDPAFGPAIGCYWYDKEDIPKLLEIENEKKFKAFPRYITFHPTLATFQRYCKKYISKIRQSDISNYFELITMLQYESYADGDSSNIQELWDQISVIKDIKQLKIILSNLSSKFTSDYYEIVNRSTYSLDDAISLKEKYLKLILKGISGLEKGSSLDKPIHWYMGVSPDEDTVITDDKTPLEWYEEVAEYEKIFKSFKNIITMNPAMMKLKCDIAYESQYYSNVSLFGETGTGKELFAELIHEASGRKGKFCTINCSNFPKNLLESELFGHVKGAFSGAYTAKVGLFEYADKGTLFLDEIGEMSLELQGKILRAVEYKVIKPVGGLKTKNVDVLLIFATNKDLGVEVTEERFRKDLFYRISSPSNHIIPLRERMEDIPILIDHFIAYFNNEKGKNVKSVSKSLMEQFKKHKWDGNVRELRNSIEEGVIKCRNSIITEDDTPTLIGETSRQQKINIKLKKSKRPSFTDEQILFAFKKADGNKSKAARLLGTTYKTINLRLKNIHN